MNPRLSAAWSVLAAALIPGAAAAEERNVWPLWVEQSPVAAETGAAPQSSISVLGPFGFYKPASAEALSARGLRPVYLDRHDVKGTLKEAYFAYPLFSFRAQPDGYRWSVMNLINRSAYEASAGNADDTGFDLWPFYFSRQTGSANTSYRALFPVYGSVEHRFGQDHLTWVLFPLYGRFEKNGVTTTTTPWPFIKVLAGDGNHGFELWPLFGRREKAGAYRERFYLWPLFYHNTKALENGSASEQLGILPFYARDRSPGYQSETYLWPFFGYVDREQPYRYHATNYFWPLWVQGRGDQRHVNRWAPFYTHSNIKGTDKTWIFWPLWRRSTWTEAGLHHERSQLLYFLYNATVQKSAMTRTLAPASKIHVWPLFTRWDNGAGRKQWQFLSPFEVFFPHNEPVRIGWSPLFALYRFEQRTPGSVRHSALWDAVTFERTASAGTKAFHLGPILAVEDNPDRYRIALGAGLIGFERNSERGSWRLFFGEFNSAKKR